MRIKTILCAALAGLLCVTSSQAALVNPSSITIANLSSENGGFNRLGIYSVNGAGLTGNTHSNGASGVAWMANASTGFITYDLGGIYPITGLKVWNYNETAAGNTDRGFKDVVITYGNTVALGSTLSAITTFAQASGLNTYTGQTFTNFAPFNARFIRITGTSNYGDATQSGLSEVQFLTIPEPATATLGLLSLAGLMLRRRKMA